MKKMLLLLLMLPALCCMAQDTKKPVSILVSAQGNTVSTYLDSNNSKRTLVLADKQDAAAKLVIMNANAKRETAYDRKFMVVNDKDADLGISFVSRLAGNTYAYLNDLLTKLQKGKTYKLYTTAIPKDPNVAATVRVQRILLCNIVMK
jgi:hypothetical protein